MGFIPQRIMIQAGLEGSQEALRVPAAAPDAEIGRFDTLSEVLSRQERLPADEAKKTLILASRRGGFVKEFPTGPGVRPPGWHYFIPAIGCPADCRYCFLQTYHRPNSPVVFAGLEAMLAEIEAKSRESGGGYFYGGELCDNLMLEPYIEAIQPLLDLFRDLPRATLELRTKSSAVEPLLQLEPLPNVIISWTFSPRSAWERFENGTARPDERISAARVVQRAGFRIGIRFDPIILLDGWRGEYESLIAGLSDALDATLVESAHLGCLRFTPALKAFCEQRFGVSAPFDGEFALGRDGKFRYPRPLRASAYRVIAEILAAWQPALPVSLCTETPGVEADFRSFQKGSDSADPTSLR